MDNVKKNIKISARPVDDNANKRFSGKSKKNEGNISSGTIIKVKSVIPRRRYDFVIYYYVIIEKLLHIFLNMQ